MEYVGTNTLLKNLYVKTDTKYITGNFADNFINCNDDYNLELLLKIQNEILLGNINNGYEYFGIYNLDFDKVSKLNIYEALRLSILELCYNTAERFLCDELINIPFWVDDTLTPPAYTFEKSIINPLEYLYKCIAHRKITTRNNSTNSFFQNSTLSKKIDVKSLTNFIFLSLEDLKGYTDDTGYSIDFKRVTSNNFIFSCDCRGMLDDDNNVIPHKLEILQYDLHATTGETLLKSNALHQTFSFSIDINSPAYVKELLAYNNIVLKRNINWIFKNA